MKKQILKSILVFFMVLGVVFSIMNITSQDSNAYMKEEQLYEGTILGQYVYWCVGDGQGCYTVTPDFSPK